MKVLRGMYGEDLPDPEPHPGRAQESQATAPGGTS